MKWYASATLLLALVLGTENCGPGRGAGRRRGPRKLTPLVFKQHVPNVPEYTLTASGVREGRISRNDTRFKDLIPNYNQDIIFKDEEGTGADRLMTQRCKEKLNTLAISVMNQWPGGHLLVTEGWDEEGHHSPDSLHYEGRAVDITTADRDRSKYGMLARLAVEAGFDWVYYESKTHLHCSVKSESTQAAKYGGCFSGEDTVFTSHGIRKKLSDLQIGEEILSLDPVSKRLHFSEVILFLDYNPLETRDFLKIFLASGRNITVTTNHLVLSGSLKNTKSVYAEKIKIGDNLIVSNSITVFEDRIIQIIPMVKKGVFAPLTRMGTIVVNDIVASCYATVDSHVLAQWAFLPLHLLSNAKQGLLPLKSIISNFKLSANMSSTVTSLKPNVGVHWYARTLHAIAHYLLPSLLYN